MAKKKSKKKYTGRARGRDATAEHAPSGSARMLKPKSMTDFMLCPGKREPGYKECAAKAKKAGAAVQSRPAVRIPGASSRRPNFRYTSPTVEVSRGNKWPTPKKQRLCEKAEMTVHKKDGTTEKKIDYTGKLKSSSKRAYQCKPSSTKPCKTSFFFVDEKFYYEDPKTGKSKEVVATSRYGESFRFERTKKGGHKELKSTRKRTSVEMRCPVELVYDHGLPALRLCTNGPEKPGVLVKAATKEEALARSHAACRVFLGDEKEVEIEAPDWDPKKRKVVTTKRKIRTRTGAMNFDAFLETLPPGEYWPEVNYSRRQVTKKTKKKGRHWVDAPSIVDPRKRVPASELPAFGPDAPEGDGRFSTRDRLVPWKPKKRKKRKRKKRKK